MVGNTPDQNRVVGVVAQTTKFGDFIVNCRHGKMSLNREIAQMDGGDFVNVGDVVSFVYSKIEHPKVHPNGEVGFVGKVFNYEKIDAISVGLSTETVSVSFPQGKTGFKLRIQCSVTYSHTNSDGVFVYKNDVLGDIFDRDKYITEKCRGEEYEVKVQWCYLHKSADSPSGWVIIHLNNYQGNTNASDRPIFGFTFYHLRKKRCMVWTLNDLPQQDYHIIIPSEVISRTSEYIMGKWVDVYCKKDAPYIADRVVPRSDTETLKEGNKRMAALVCTFRGSLTNERDYLLSNDLVGDVVCMAHLDWKPDQTRKMWCYIECDPKAHWVALYAFEEQTTDISNSIARKGRVPSNVEPESKDRNVRGPASSDVRIMNGLLKTNGYRHDSAEDQQVALVGSIPPRDSAYYSVNGDDRHRNTHGVMEGQGYNIPGRSDDEMLSMDGMSLAEERSPVHYAPRGVRNGGRRRSFSSLDPFENSDSVTLSSETRAVEKLRAQTHWMKRLLQYEEVKNVAQKCDQEAYVKLLETLSGVR